MSIDLLGNETTSRTVLDQTAHTETTTVQTPDSLAPSISKSVAGRLMESTDKTGVKTTFIYDALGRRTGVVDARTGTAVTHYNNKGQVDYVKDAANHTTTFEYDPATGRKVLERNALGNETHYAYNIFGQLTATWGDSVYPVAYTYDSLGRREHMYTFQDGDFTDTMPTTSASVTTWIYDPASGQLTAKEDADGQQVTYTYQNGRLKTRTWSQNGTTTYNYDGFTGELTSIDYSGTTPDISFTYDRLGRQVSVADAVGTRTFVYDPATLQLVAEQISGTINQTLYRNYDALGRSDGMTTGADYNIDYGFDSTGRFASVDYGADSLSIYNYVANSGLLSGVQNAHVQTTYTYEPKRNLKTAVTNTSGGNTVSRYTYQYDELGRRTSAQNSGTAFFITGDAFNKYGYNDRNEVTSSNRYIGTDVADLTDEITAEAQAYAYDAIGNRQSAEASGVGGQATYETNSLNQYTTLNAETLTYDADGNLTLKPAVAEGEGGQTTFEYNGENRLVTAVTGTQRLTFTYDYMGRRVQKSVYESDVLQEKRQYLYDGWNLIRETVLDASDVVTDTKYYAWGLDLSQSMQGAGGVGGLLAMWDGDDNKVYYYAYDANGNVGQLIDSSDNSIAARYEYDAFGGEIVADGVMAQENGFRFSTKYVDGETGLVYYGFRYYLAELGRWLSRDPIEERGGVNLYQAVHNSLVNWIDYLGLTEKLQKERIAFALHGSRLGQEGHLSWAQSTFGDQNAYAINSGREMLDILSARSKSDEDSCHCIQAVFVYGHATTISLTMDWNAGFVTELEEWFTDSPLADDDDEIDIFGPSQSAKEKDAEERKKLQDNGARDISDLRRYIKEKKIKFCSSCDFQIHGCNAGNEGGIAQSFSAVTPCTVKASRGSSSPVNKKKGKKETASGRFYSEYGWAFYKNGKLIGPKKKLNYLRFW